jgi:hypothetical protein
MGTLFVDDKQASQARVEKTVPFIFSGDDFMDIGEDSGVQVTEKYGTPKGCFNGKINWVWAQPAMAAPGQRRSNGTRWRTGSTAPRADIERF